MICVAILKHTSTSTYRQEIVVTLAFKHHDIQYNGASARYNGQSTILIVRIKVWIACRSYKTFVKRINISGGGATLYKIMQMTDSVTLQCISMNLAFSPNSHGFYYSSET